MMVFLGRTKAFSVQIFQSDGITPVALQTGDYVRFKVSYGTGLPLLDLINGTPSSNGSSITIQSAIGAAAEVLIELTQGDTAEWGPGTFDAEIGVVDGVDDGYFKTAMIGTITVIPVAGGAVGT
jgi:hypothetical protein